jgi:hypothetical protein
VYRAAAWFTGHHTLPFKYWKFRTTFLSNAPGYPKENCFFKALVASPSGARSIKKYKGIVGVRGERFY